MPVWSYQKGYEQGKKDALKELKEYADTICYCGKYAECPVTKKIKELNKK